MTLVTTLPAPFTVVPLSPEAGGIKFVLTLPVSDLSFRIAHCDGQYQFQVWEADNSELSFACNPTPSYAVALRSMLYQIAVDELDHGGYEHEGPQDRQLLDLLGTD
jgi:hypothetical protein